ncbi:MAG TPA: hypothetical protein VE912_22975, partial [Bacteroidales bacterium]|nr:hypothetical protein [Bacteroidales bacterium]
MEFNLDYQEYIQRYLDEEMTPDELKWFLSELDQNIPLQQEVELHRQVMDAIGEEDIMALRDQLDNIYEKETSTLKPPKSRPTSGRKNKKRLIAVSSALSVIIITIMVFFNQPDQSTVNNKIFQEYYKPYDVTMNYRSAETGVDMILRKAFNEYENHDYSAALVLFQEVLKKRPEDNATNLYTGVSQIETQQYNAANHKFKTIMSNGANLYYEQAEWYSGFCYLKMDSTLEAINVYKNIASG